MNTLGSRIRTLRLQKGFTQGELAKGICTSSMISQIETGRAYPSPSVILSIAERLEVPVALLLDNLELGLESKSKYMLAKALQEAGEHPLALSLLEELKNTDPAIPILEFQYLLGICYANTYQWQKAFSTVDALLESSIIKGDRRMIILALLAHAEVAAGQKLYPLAIHHAERAMNEYKKLDEPLPDLHAKVLAKLAALYQQIGVTDKATYYYQELITIYEHISDPAQASQTYLSLAKSSQARGLHDQSLQYATRALALFQHIDNQKAFCDTQIQLLLLTCNESNWKNTVRELLGIAVQLEEQEVTRERAGGMFAALSAVCLQFGNLEQAEMLAVDALQILTEEHADAGRAHRTLALIRLQQSEMVDADEHLRLASAIFMKHNLGTELEEVTRVVTENFRRVGRYEESLTHLQTYHNYVVQQISERGIVL